jgi:hypothetical protein
MRVCQLNEENGRDGFVSKKLGTPDGSMRVVPMTDRIVSLAGTLETRKIEILEIELKKVSPKLGNNFISAVFRRIGVGHLNSSTAEASKSTQSVDLVDSSNDCHYPLEGERNDLAVIQTDYFPTC